MARRHETAWLAIVASVAAAVACRRSPETPKGSVEARVDARLTSAPRTDGGRREAAAAAQPEAPQEDAAAAAASLNDAVCRRPRCCVTRVMPAGMGADGTRYTVVRLDLRPTRRRCAPPNTGDEEDEIDPAAVKANEEGHADDEVCKRYRWDLVAEKNDKVAWRQPLAVDDWCISAFGVGGGEDEMSADGAARTVTYRLEFGSTSRSDERVTLGVDPFRVVSSTLRSWWTLGENESHRSWNWDTFSGSESRSIDFCGPDGVRDGDGDNPDAGAEIGDRGEPIAATDGVIVPKIGLPAAFVRDGKDGKDGWSSISFRDCAAHVDGKDLGYTIHGPARGDGADSQMWVVMSSSGTLFVEVTDDRLVPSAKSWVKADHLEIWREAGESSVTQCLQHDPGSKALQWGIDLDGKVYRAHGAPTSNPTVRVSRSEGGARFRIVLPTQGHGLTVVYSDSDDGAHQKRLIATSRLVYGRSWTVGDVSTIAPKRATCVLDGDRLRPKVEPLRRTRELLLQNLPADFAD